MIGLKFSDGLAMGLYDNETLPNTSSSAIREIGTLWVSVSGTGDERSTIMTSIDKYTRVDKPLSFHD